MGVAGVLTHEDLLDLLELAPTDPPGESRDGGVIQPCIKRNVRTASYDLRLGDEYYVASQDDRGGVPISRLVQGRNETLVIEPNQVVIVMTHEKLVLPTDLVGHLSLKHNLLLRGLIMSNQSQIDAGFEGHLYTLLYNLSSSRVPLKYLESFLRLELVRLHSATSGYQGDFKDAKLSEVLREPIDSSLRDMQRTVDHQTKSIESAKASLSVTQIAGVLVAAFVTIVSTVFSGWIEQWHDENFDELETEVTRKVDRLEAVSKDLDRWKELSNDTLRIRARLQEVEKKADALATGAVRVGSPASVEELRSAIEGLRTWLEAIEESLLRRAPPGGAP